MHQGWHGATGTFTGVAFLAVAVLPSAVRGAGLLRPLRFAAPA